MIEQIRERRPPFDATWQKWHLEAAWRTPAIADGWELLESSTLAEQASSIRTECERMIELILECRAVFDDTWQ